MTKRVIWKYDVPIQDSVQLNLPEGGRILTFQVQGGVPRIWVMLNPDAPTEVRNFRVYGTGNPIPPDPEDVLPIYIGTVQVDGFVWHLYEHWLMEDVSDIDGPHEFEDFPFDDEAETPINAS